MIEAACAGFLFNIFAAETVTTPRLLSVLILYNVLAFALRPVLGLGVDHFQIPRLAAAAGCVLTALGLILGVSFPLAGLITATIGNALFHVGAGGISFNLTPRGASAPGVFSALGGLGLVTGTIIGKAGYFTAWPFIILLLAFSCSMLAVRSPDMRYEWQTKKNAISHFELVLLLMFFCTSVGSYIVLSFALIGGFNAHLVLGLAFAGLLGRGAGGFIADRFGWSSIAVGSLLTSLPCLILGPYFSFVALIGIFLFNIPAPIAATAVSNMLPGRSGFAFGLVSLALLFGALLAFSHFHELLMSSIILAFGIAVSALTLFWGLRLPYQTAMARMGISPARP
jgi:hypothetical protein